MRNEQKLATERISAVFCITLNERPYQPKTTRPDTLRFLSQLISSPCVSAISARVELVASHQIMPGDLGRVLETKAHGERSGRRIQRCLQKVRGLSRGTRLSLEQTRKELMSALIVAKPCIDRQAAVSGRRPHPRERLYLVGEGGRGPRGDYRSPSLEPRYLKSA